MSALTSLLAKPLGWRPGPWPGQCEVCRRWADQRLCGHCVAAFAAPRPRCTVCAMPQAAAVLRCADCRRQPPAFEACTCAVDYGFPWDRLITAFKYQGRVELAPALVRLMAGALGDGDRGWPELLLPVPLAPDRLRERGYNQAWELARRLAPLVGRPASARGLRRDPHRPRQAELGREQRLHNLQDVFQVTDASAVAGRRVVLVDDVMTTGATAEQAARALRQAGAAAVRVWVLARTP